MDFPSLLVQVTEGTKAKNGSLQWGHKQQQKTEKGSKASVLDRYHPLLGQMCLGPLAAN